MATQQGAGELRDMLKANLRACQGVDDRMKDEVVASFLRKIEKAERKRSN